MASFKEVSKRNPKYLNMTVYGESVMGNETFALKFSNKDLKMKNNRPSILITGGVHGDEYMGIVEQLSKWLAAPERNPTLASFFNNGGIVYLAPTVNPDGLILNKRKNKEKIDLNRDFFPFHVGPKQVETRSLVKWIEKDLKKSNSHLVLAVDYHCCNGSLLYPRKSKSSSLYYNALEKIGSLMKKSINPGYKTGLTKDILGYDSFGTMKDYWFHTHRALSFTFEGINRKDEFNNYKKHFVWWENIIGTIDHTHQNYLSGQHSKTFIDFLISRLSS